MNVIELSNITYTPPDRESPIMKNVDLTINQGEFVLLEGENFSGKSTIIDLILGIRYPDNDDAEVKLFGYLPNSIEARLLTGVVFQEQIELPSWTQVGQFMNLIESHYPNSKGKVKSVLEKSSIIVNDEFIKKRTNDRTRTPFAGSEARFFSLALALARSPKLLILDEPTAPLTPENKRKFWQYIKEFTKENGATVLLVSPKDKENESLIERELRDNGIEPTKKLFLDKESKQLSVTSSTSTVSEEVKTNCDNFEKIGVFHWVILTLNYAGINFQKLQAQPIRPLLDFLFGIAVVIMFAFFFKELRNRDGLSSIIPYSEFWLLANICSFYLALVSTTSIGINIVLGRKEAGWIKYRQTLPVPSLVYLLGEIIPYWLIWSILAFMLTIASSIFLDLSLYSALDISKSLVIGMLPFLFLGLAIGYGLPLGSVDLIALGLPLLFAMPLVVEAFLKIAIIANLELPKYVVLADYISAYSPLYHWVQLALASVQAREYDQYFMIHVAWLIWTTAICALLAVKAYRRSYKFAIASTDRSQEG